MTGHRLFTLAALTLLAVACNREAVFPEEGREEVIDFSAFFAQDATKAAGEINDIEDFAELPDSIGVFACYTGDMEYDLTSVSPDFMYNQKVTYDGGNWTYSPVKYWPNNTSEKISFFSYYPYISSENALEAEDGIIGFSKSNAKGDPWLVYKLPKEAPYAQTDLMYGVPKLNQQKPAVSSGEMIEFQLKHALACMADSVTVKMSPELYAEMKDTLDISITGLRIVYSNLTNKARLVLNSDEEAIWKEVMSGELQTSRTYVPENFTTQTFSKDVKADTVLTLDQGNGLFYIPLQIEGQPMPEARITLTYLVNGVEDHGSFADSVVTVKQFTPGDAGKKQWLSLTLTKDFNLNADIITEADGISMPDDLEAWYKDVKIDYEITDTFSFYHVTDSTSVMQKYVVPRTGTYTLEAWGAKGGRGVDDFGGAYGALGGYAKAQFNLSIGDTLYLYVGGKGGDSTTGPNKYLGGSRGWNGGGHGGRGYQQGAQSGGGGGGGATHIAMSDIGPIGESSLTKLSDHVGTVGHLLLVAAGGGGGGSYERDPGAGGGTEGIKGYSLTDWYNSVYSYGADGGAGYYGGDSEDGNGGGGGGYIGGSAKGYNSTPSSGGSGGSSNANTARYNYVSNSFITKSSGEDEYVASPDEDGNGLVVITFVNELL